MATPQERRTATRARLLDAAMTVLVEDGAAGFTTTEVGKRAGLLALNALSIWGPSIRQGCFVIEPFPELAGNPIHERDVADVIVADLLDPARRGRIDTIVGPDTLTKRQQVTAIATAIGEPIELRYVTPDEARAFYRDQGGFLFGFDSYDGVTGAVDEPHDTGADPTDITGAPPAPIPSGHTTTRPTSAA